MMNMTMGAITLRENFHRAIPLDRIVISSHLLCYFSV